MQITAAAWLLLLAAYEVLRKKNPTKQSKQPKYVNKTIFRSFSSSVKHRDLAECASRSDLTSPIQHREGFTEQISSRSPAPLCSPSLSTQSSAHTGTGQREPRTVQSPMQSPPALHASLACCHHAGTRCSQPFSSLNNLLQFQEPDRSGSQARAFQSHL